MSRARKDSTHNRVMLVDWNPIYGEGDDVDRELPDWLVHDYTSSLAYKRTAPHGSLQQFTVYTPRIYIASCRENGVKYPSLVCAPNKERVGVFDADTFELGWFLEYLELRCHWRRFLDPVDDDERSRDDGLRMFGRRIILAPESFSRTGELPKPVCTRPS